MLSWTIDMNDRPDGLVWWRLRLKRDGKQIDQVMRLASSAEEALAAATTETLIGLRTAGRTEGERT
jgi:hypothetical protein